MQISIKIACSLGLDMTLFPFHTEASTRSVTLNLGPGAGIKPQTWIPLGRRACEPQDCGTACLRFPGIEPPQADTKCIDPCSKKRQTKEIIAPNGGLTTEPNGGIDLATISFSNLKSTPATNQKPAQERGTGPQPGPMTSTLKQDNQAAKLRFLTNERTPGPSAILSPLGPSTQFPRPWPSQCPDEPPMENVKFGGGYYIDPRTPRSKLIAIFE
ncbi:hypothetical protein DSO57_1018945 [Entomophthora muscae]|uniref:Uncharacterized protein n=1 Tax=Entomophthora muscae TaxID=34485 RepID=A0ACC2U2G0_9FUNG|nr:hypothetical protein DSO57_1018945 [Entomophthora muscae]